MLCDINHQRQSTSNVSLLLTIDANCKNYPASDIKTNPYQHAMLYTSILSVHAHLGQQILTLLLTPLIYIFCGLSNYDATMIHHWEQ